jgi:hypothetical protein
MQVFSRKLAGAHEKSRIQEGMFITETQRAQRTNEPQMDADYIGFDYRSCQSVSDRSLDDILFVAASKDNKAMSDLIIR